MLACCIWPPCTAARTRSAPTSKLSSTAASMPDLEIARAAVAPVRPPCPRVNHAAARYPTAYDSLLANAPHPPTPLEINQ